MSLRDEILAILRQDLGPAAPIFLEKCCERQLRRTSQEITSGDIDLLADCFYHRIATSIGEQKAEQIRDHVRTIR